MLGGTPNGVVELLVQLGFIRSDRAFDLFLEVRIHVWQRKNRCPSAKPETLLNRGKHLHKMFLVLLTAASGYQQLHGCLPLLVANNLLYPTRRKAPVRGILRNRGMRVLVLPQFDGA